jgi:hypothetical protein
MQQLAAQIVVSETGLSVGPTICRTMSIASCLQLGSLQLKKKCRQALGEWEYGGNVLLVGQECPLVPEELWLYSIACKHKQERKKKKARITCSMRGSRGHILWHDRSILRETLAHRDAGKSTDLDTNFPHERITSKCRPRCCFGVFSHIFDRK